MPLYHPPERDHDEFLKAIFDRLKISDHDDSIGKKLKNVLEARRWYPSIRADDAGDEAVARINEWRNQVFVQLAAEMVADHSADRKEDLEPQIDKARRSLFYRAGIGIPTTAVLFVIGLAVRHSMPEVTFQVLAETWKGLAAVGTTVTAAVGSDYLGRRKEHKQADALYDRETEVHKAMHDALQEQMKHAALSTHSPADGNTIEYLKKRIRLDKPKYQPWLAGPEAQGDTEHSRNRLRDFFSRGRNWLCYCPNANGYRADTLYVGTKITTICEDIIVEWLGAKPGPKPRDDYPDSYPEQRDEILHTGPIITPWTRYTEWLTLLLTRYALEHHMLSPDGLQSVEAEMEGADEESLADRITQDIVGLEHHLELFQTSIIPLRPESPGLSTGPTLTRREDDSDLMPNVTNNELMRPRVADHGIRRVFFDL